MSVLMERPLTVAELLETTHPHCFGGGEVLNFKDEPGLDVYNPSKPFIYNSRLLMAGRSEPRGEINSTTKFYAYDSITNSWNVEKSLPQLPLEDPFIAKIQGEWVLGGVKVHKNPSNFDPKHVESYETWFYRGETLENLTHFAAVEHMKDIRMAPSNGHINLLTRPQGAIGGPGKIGFTQVKSLDDLKNPKVFTEAPIIENLFAHDVGEWGGGNEILGYTSDGWLRILGHIARFNGLNQDSGERNREYYPITAEIDTKKLVARNLGILACRGDFPQTASKEPHLEKVFFSSALDVSERGPTLIGGLSDTAIGSIKLPKNNQPIIKL